ncbi:RHS repeat protein [Nocardioides sp. W3-2-3]|uniref:RHS repeat domain-containing protein n=1 Tax=Nocardioides convexus TaxID=2712224 RepID=UPI002418A761|nr:RHS repeat domain-containing protein [Nocardioides convexus]NHA00298.1 RHS repeat protein [Nocardioides convexus]
MDYNADGQMTAVYNEIGDVVTMKYDARGNVTERTTCRTAPGVSPADCSTSYTTYPTSTSGYGALDPRWDKPLTKVDPRAGLYWAPSYITEYTYNEAGQPAHADHALARAWARSPTPTRVPASRRSTAASSPSGLPLTTTDASSAKTRLRLLPVR